MLSNYLYEMKILHVSMGTQNIAIRKFLSQEKRLMKNLPLKEEYDRVLEEYLQLDHMQLISKQIDLNKEDVVYLPHHAVLRLDKTTSNVRVVFNASSKGDNGVSLNDDLMVGPRLQTDLRHLIMRFRIYPICLVADVVKMYRMVKVTDEDADLQRLVWRRNPEEDLKHYKLSRVTFGTSSAPYLAVKALQQLALDEGENLPLAANRVLNDFYVDDLMTTCRNVDEAVEVYKQLNELMQRGGFQLQKWSSNNKELLERVHQEATKDILNIIADDITKILGLTWNKKSDRFVYSVTLAPQTDAVTKRSAISDISRLYDPLGWIAPCIIKAKIFIQKLWISGIDWDEGLPEDLLKEWNVYREELKILCGYHIPRWIGHNEDSESIEIHGFCDASNAAFAAAVYTRVISSDGLVRVNLLTAKTKVAPIKQISIPRLELCGAVLLAKLLKEVAGILNIDSSCIHAWTDSTIVLAWLRGHPNRWKTFVANRVSEILNITNSSQWSHVQSCDNPADIASRGINPSELSQCELWLNGPIWLKNNTIVYSHPDFKTELEEKVIKLHATTVKGNDNDTLFTRFSTLTRLLRVVAYCRRILLLKIPKQNRPGLSPHLTSQEISEAMTVCIKKSQEEEFLEDIKCYEQEGNVKRRSKLHSLTPFMDEQKIFRVRGRINNAEVSYAEKHPIILSNKSHFTGLVVADAHEKTLHGGPQLMMTYLRSNYWIIGGKNLIKKYYHNCKICIRHNASTNNQLMGQLPSVRTTMSRPFSNSGVDYAGPITIRVSKGRGHRSYKGYICLFVCMATRAVHLEAVSDMTTQGFLSAFKRFVARRGHCRQIWSDNGTNFVGAAKELQVLFTKEKTGMASDIADWLATNGTSWHFIPPHAPHFGGIWEAGIKSTKFHLKRILGNSTLTYEEMATVLSQIEACLNSRPIAQASLGHSPDDPLPLTPGHFLVGEPLVLPPDHNYETESIGVLKRWQLTQHMVQVFWRRWSIEYLNQFSHRYKWAKVNPEPKVGDIVLVKEVNLPPAKWPYGRIMEKHPGLDGLTRVVTLRCRNSLIKRPITKLCILPMTE